MTPIPELTGLRLREAVAVEVMGMVPENVGSLVMYGMIEESWVRAEHLPHWESDRTAAQQVIERIEAMGLTHRLCHFLLIASGYDGLGTFNFIEVGLLATPEAICQAVLAVVREHRKEQR